MFQDRCYDRNVDVDTNFYASDMTNNFDVSVDVNGNYDPNTTNMMQSTCPSRPLIEPMQERCVHRTIMHEVPHVCPIRTKIINHHIYKHTYRPEYSCCEENVVSNIQEGSCCNY